MKHKKVIQKFLLMSLLMICIQASPAYALKQAIFPDSKSLQPMPQNSFPNVSGNINSSVDSAPAPQEESTPGVPESTVAPQQIADKNGSSISTYVVWSIVIILFFILGFIVYFKKRKIK